MRKKDLCALLYTSGLHCTLICFSDTANPPIPAVCNLQTWQALSLRGRLGFNGVLHPLHLAESFHAKLELFLAKRRGGNVFTTPHFQMLMGTAPYCQVRSPSDLTRPAAGAVHKGIIVCFSYNKACLAGLCSLMAISSPVRAGSLTM